MLAFVRRFVQGRNFRLDNRSISKAWVEDEETGIGIRRFYLLELGCLDCVLRYRNLVTLPGTVVGDTERTLGSLFSHSARTSIEISSRAYG